MRIYISVSYKNSLSHKKLRNLAPMTSPLVVDYKIMNSKSMQKEENISAWVPYK